MRPGLAKIINKIRISRHIRTLVTELDNAENACCIDYSATWLSKRVYWLSKCESTYRSTTYDGTGNMVESDTGVASASLPIMRIHPAVAQESKVQWLPATLYNTGWMDHCEVRHESVEAIPILDPLDLAMAYSDSASHHRCLQWHARLYGRRFANFS